MSHARAGRGRRGVVEHGIGVCGAMYICWEAEIDVIE